MNACRRLTRQENISRKSSGNGKPFESPGQGSEKLQDCWTTTNGVQDGTLPLPLRNRCTERVIQQARVEWPLIYTKRLSDHNDEEKDGIHVVSTKLNIVSALRSWGRTPFSKGIREFPVQRTVLHCYPMPHRTFFAVDSTRVETPKLETIGRIRSSCSGRGRASISATL